MLSPIIAGIINVVRLGSSAIVCRWKTWNQITNHPYICWLIICCDTDLRMDIFTNIFVITCIFQHCIPIWWQTYVARYIQKPQWNKKCNGLRAKKYLIVIQGVMQNKHSSWYCLFLLGFHKHVSIAEWTTVTYNSIPLLRQVTVNHFAETFTPCDQCYLLMIWKFQNNFTIGNCKSVDNT